MAHFPQRSHSPQRPRRIGVGAALAAGAAAAAALAMLAVAPAAYADQAEVPSVPFTTSDYPLTGSFGIQPLFDVETYNSSGGYTDLLGDVVTNNSPALPLAFGDITLNPLAPVPTVFAQMTDPNDEIAFLSGPDAEVDGSTIDEVFSPTGFDQLYELTPVEGVSGPSDNVDFISAYVPVALGSDGNGIEFGIQYIDLPDATTPVDEINILGENAAILLSIPVSGDLLSLF
jgi:hypothetical protein